MAMQVSAALVVARVENDRVVHLYKGDTVPKDITKDSLDNLKALGFVTSDDVDSIPEAPSSDDSDAPQRSRRSSK